MSDSCATCRFFKLDAGQIGKVKSGRCRYNPVVAIPLPAQGPNGQTIIAIEGGFPATLQEWWCGKWEQAQATAVEFDLPSFRFPVAG